MAKNRKTPDMNLPVWFDGQNINEALFCEEFLQERRIIFANGAFFTPNGRVTDDLPLRGEIYDKLKFCAVNLGELFVKPKRPMKNSDDGQLTLWENFFGQ